MDDTTYAHLLIGPAPEALAERLVASFDGAYMSEAGAEYAVHDRDGAIVPTAEPVRDYGVHLPGGLHMWLMTAAAQGVVDALMDANVSFYFHSVGEDSDSTFIYDWAPGQPFPLTRDADTAGNAVLSRHALSRLQCALPADAGPEVLLAAIDLYLRAEVEPTRLHARGDITGAIHSLIAADDPPHLGQLWHGDMPTNRPLSDQATAAAR